MTSAVEIEFDTYFRPTNQQLKYAQEYMAEAGLTVVFVTANYPGKQRGVWVEGQTCETVMDGAFPALWTDRRSALKSFDTGNYGNALFRVFVDGQYSLVDEAR